MFTEAITPIQRFFVRCHTNVPHVNLKTWSLRIKGVVNRPLSLTMDDLRKLPRTELVSVLECAGNGRAFLSTARCRCAMDLRRRRERPPGQCPVKRCAAKGWRESSAK
jgi:DMSO/TMAO reductase YedYZ molybdopterin-dependent catalytic subunit